MKLATYITVLYTSITTNSVVNAFAFVSRAPRQTRKTCRAPSLLILRASTVINETDTTSAEIIMTETHMRVPEVEESEFDLPAKSLDGRLLCASQCAYDAIEPYFEGAGYLSGSMTVELTKGVNSVYIGETVDGIVLAFRGTRTKSPLDWLQNAALLLRRVDGMPGRVHAGFFRAVNSIWKPIKSTLQDMINDLESNNNTTPKIYMTGHSKGGE